MPVTSGQTVPLTSGGALGSQSPLSAAGTLVAPVGFDLGLEKALITGVAGGVELLVDSGGGYGSVATLGDTPTRYLADVADSVGFAISGTHYIATLSSKENGVNLAQVSSTSIAQADALGAAEGLPIASPTEIDAIQRLGETTLIVGSSGTSSLSTVNVDATGTLLIADHILDSPETFVQGVSAIDAVTYGDFAFFAAAGADGGVSLFTVLPGGRIIFFG